MGLSWTRILYIRVEFFYIYKVYDLPVSNYNYKHPICFPRPAGKAREVAIGCQHHMVLDKHALFITRLYLIMTLIISLLHRNHHLVFRSESSQHLLYKASSITWLALRNSFSSYLNTTVTRFFPKLLFWTRMHQRQ